MIDINVKKGNEEDEDFIGALQDIQVYIWHSKNVKKQKKLNKIRF